MLRWKIVGKNKEEVKNALNEFVKEFYEVMAELSKKQIEVPMLGRISMPVFNIDYEDAGDGFILNAHVPLSDSKLFRFFLRPQMKSAEKNLRKFFERKNLEVEIKRIG